MGILIILLGGMMIGAGLVGAFASALLCAVAALIGRQGPKNVVKYAGFGAAFGFFITPWPYVVGRAFNKLLAPPLMVLVMAPVFLVWAAVTAVAVVGEIVYIWDVTTGFGGWQAPRANPISAFFVSLGLAILLIICLGTCYLSMRGTYKRYKAERIASQPGNDPDWAYLSPFMFMYMWFVGLVIIAIMAAVYLVSIGVDIQGF